MAPFASLGTEVKGRRAGFGREGSVFPAEAERGGRDLRAVYVAELTEELVVIGEEQTHASNPKKMSEVFNRPPWLLL